ncbi:MAG: hypothetical protein JNL80_04120 [Phycisphaerae bacterium]|jgi:hypothetical protein|nr:hypothetical protein [Phycisphaerae bacterium]
MPLTEPRQVGDQGAVSPRVEEAIPCAECAYNLIGQPQTGRCPECGYLVDESIRAGGFWTQQRVRMLRISCWLFALSVPAWSVAAGISRVASPSPLLRGIVATLAVIHVGALLGAAYLGLGASSRLSRQSRIILLVCVGVAVVAVMTTPLLVVAGLIARASSSMTAVLVAANIERLALLLMSAWWITSGTKSLRPMWSGTVLSQRLAMAVLIAGWCPLAMSLLFGAANSPTMNPALQALGNVAVTAEAIATLLFASLGLAVSSSLGRTPHRVSYASEG